MFKPRTSLKDIILGLGLKYVAKSSENQLNVPPKMDKVLILSKLSRYEFEKRKYKIKKDSDLERELRNRGTDFDTLIQSHDLHKRFERNVAETFSKRGINVEIVNRFDYTEERIKWANLVIPVGGDGTFLLASSKIKDNSKAVIGFNSDPTRSEGHLCVPKIYSANLSNAVDKLQRGEFSWLLRNRIRIKLISQRGSIVPKCLHELQDCADFRKVDPLNSNVLPVLALNEVFVGETTSSRVSYLQMRINGSSEQTSIKCSGVCVCTGTGSTSWHLSINRIPIQSLAELLKLVPVNSEKEKEALAEEISEVYNKRLVFKPNDERMCYTIRDLISAGVWPNPKGIKPREFISKLELKSNCYDASLVVDGGVSFDFNDGTIAFLEIRPEDALRTVSLTD